MSTEYFQLFILCMNIFSVGRVFSIIEVANYYPTGIVLERCDSAIGIN